MLEPPNSRRGKAARREVGEKQGVFVSGSVLAVDCRVPFDFFPDLYNEDWLFFHRDAAEGRLVTPGSLAEQLPYDPSSRTMAATQAPAVTARSATSN